MVQFAAMDSGLLAWDFYVRDEAGQIIGSVNRNFAGFGRELFTDTGQVFSLILFSRRLSLTSRLSSMFYVSKELYKNFQIQL